MQQMARLIATNIAAPGFNFTDGRFDHDKYKEDCQKYIDDLRKLIGAGKDELVGEIVRWQRADGYAEYMIAKTEPLELIHIETGDAYTVEAPLIRGLNLDDVRDMVEREQRIAKLFS